jgi:thiol-disulfide isomerase/thioredoxin
MRIITLLLSLLLSSPALAAELSKERAQVSNFSLQTLKGDQFKFESVKGQVVVLSFWASWCKPCIQELGFLKQLLKKHPGQFVVLAVSTDDSNTISGVRKIVRTKKLSMPILLDAQGSLMGELNPRGTLPYSVYIDREGKIAARHDGFASGDEAKLEAMIMALIAEGATQKADDTPKK